MQNLHHISNTPPLIMAQDWAESIWEIIMEG